MTNLCFLGRHHKSSSLFGGIGGKKAFGVGAGAGFLGGAVATAGAVSVYHRYQMYKAILQGHRTLVVNRNSCIGGCPNQARNISTNLYSLVNIPINKPDTEPKVSVHVQLDPNHSHPS